MKINVKVVANSSKSEIIFINNFKYKVYLKKPAIDNKANQELVRLMKKYFKSEVNIIKGHNSRDKILEVKEN
jgi:uncharacterized protein (TIGR00251 family)